MKENQMGWTCSANGTDEKRVHSFSLQTCKERGHLGDLNIDGRIILKWLIKKYVVRMWTDFMWLRIGSSGSLF
jgi:hypothetical protein